MAHGLCLQHSTGSGRWLPLVLIAQQPHQPNVQCSQVHTLSLEPVSDLLRQYLPVLDPASEGTGQVGDFGLNRLAAGGSLGDCELPLQDADLDDVCDSGLRLHGHLGFHSYPFWCRGALLKSGLFLQSVMVITSPTMSLTDPSLFQTTMAELHSASMNEYSISGTGPWSIPLPSCISNSSRGEGNLRPLSRAREPSSALARFLIADCLCKMERP
jgi:hypothetical protein